jgi:hypothetical protein
MSPWTARQGIAVPAQALFARRGKRQREGQCTKSKSDEEGMRAP